MRAMTKECPPRRPGRTLSARSLLDPRVGLRNLTSSDLARLVLGRCLLQENRHRFVSIGNERFHRPQGVRWLGQPKFWEAVEQCGQRHQRLQPSQGSTQAVMHAVAKREVVTAVWTGDVERVGRGPKD